MQNRLDMVESFIVCVGEEPKEFHVVKSIATRSSKFFQAAMTRDWKEALERRVLLPEVDPDDFEGYLQWLYTSDIAFAGAYRSVVFVELYILSDFLDDLAFRNAVPDYQMTEWVANHNVPSEEATRLAWDNTPPDSPLRHLVIVLWSSAPFEWAVTRLVGPKKIGKEYPREFALQYFQSFMSSHALKNKRVNRRSRAKVAAEFNLWRSGGLAGEENL
jgi:hypothetical protein